MKRGYSRKGAVVLLSGQKERETSHSEINLFKWKEWKTEGVSPGRTLHPCEWVKGHVLGSGCWKMETEVKDNHCGLESRMPVTLRDGKMSS